MHAYSELSIFPIISSLFLPGVPHFISISRFLNFLCFCEKGAVSSSGRETERDAEDHSIHYREVQRVEFHHHLCQIPSLRSAETHVRK
jgi:hypothetical protein